MKNRKISALTIIVILALASASFAAEKESLIQKLRRKFLQKKPPPVSKVPEAKQPMPAHEVKQAKPKKELTKEELLVEMREILDSEEEVLDYIPELKKKKDESGKEFYTYNVSGQEVRLEEMDKDSLENLLTRAHQTATKIRTDW